MPAGSSTSSARRHAAVFCASGSGTRIALASSRVVKGTSSAGISAAASAGPRARSAPAPRSGAARPGRAGSGGRAPGAGARTWSSRHSRTSIVRCGCESRVGKETRPSKIVAAPGASATGAWRAPRRPRRCARSAARAGIGWTIRIAVAVEQRVELCPQRGETAGLDLDELAVGAHEVDHVAVDAHLEGVAGRRPERLQLAVQRRLRADVRSRRRTRSITPRSFVRSIALDLWPDSVHTAAHGFQNRFRNMEERVTIRELARRSGVSVGTVSRALNGYADVRPETRERIMRLASRARLHARRRRPLPRHPALATSSACSWRPARAIRTCSTRSSTRCSAGSSSASAPRASTCCCSPPSAPAAATARTPTSSAPATTTSTAAR